MKKMLLKLKSLPLASMMAAFALSMTTIAANSECYYCFHQPEMPDGVKKFRKF